MTRSIAMLAGCVVAVGSIGAAVSGRRQDTPELRVPAMKTLTATDVDNVRRWARAVRQHRPGEVDEGARSVAAWREADVVTVLAAIKCLYGAATAQASTRRDSSAVFLPCGRSFPTAEIDSLFGLSGGLSAGGDPGGANGFLHRAVLLYTDLALYVGAPPRNRPPGSLVVEDSHAAGSLDTQFEWSCARWLLVSVRPDWRSDATVGAWFRATTAYLEGQSRLGDALPNVSQAIELLPDDAALRFDAGALHEAFGSARTQNTIAATAPPAGTQIAIGDATSEFTAAQRSFRDALAREDRAETRLHLGHVLDALGQHEEAVRELEAAAVVVSDPDLQYDAALFLGHAEALLGHRARAEAAFERAAQLFPRAQSPLLALCHMARTDDDGTGADAAVARLEALPPDAARRDDPWWRYSVSHARDADAQMADVRRPYLRPAAR